jgi:hypothetical protein
VGWKPGILNGEGDKPKCMRWRTFERLAAEHDAFVGESLAAMALRGRVARFRRPSASIHTYDLMPNRAIRFRIAVTAKRCFGL